MFVCFTFVSSVINLIYLRQLVSLAAMKISLMALTPGQGGVRVPQKPKNQIKTFIQ
jgi:hypothetical protein